MERQRSQHNQLSFVYTLLQNRRSSATEAVDKIYAFCGLAGLSELEELGIIPGSTVDCNELYKRFAFRALKTYRNLDILSVPRLREDQEPSSLPSWVPDWRTLDSSFCLLFAHGEANALEPGWHSRFQASKGSKSVLEFKEGDTILGLEGFITDQVESVGAVADDYFFAGIPSIKEISRFSKLYLLQRNWEKTTNARSKAVYITEETILDSLWRTCHLGTSPSDLGVLKEQFDLWDKLFRWRLDIRLLTKLGLPIFPWIFLMLPLSSMIILAILCRGYSYHEIVTSHIQVLPRDKFTIDRRMIRTRDGYIGLVPRSTQLGDSIGLFKGGKVPFVVRRADAGRWQLVGECYIHGIMEGEAWSEEKCEMKWFC